MRSAPFSMNKFQQLVCRAPAALSVARPKGLLFGNIQFGAHCPGERRRTLSGFTYARA